MRLSYGVTVSMSINFDVTVFALQVDPVDLAQQHPDVLLFTQDQPGGRGDLAFGQDPGGDLV